MANELTMVESVVKTLITSGSSMADGAFQEATDATVSAAEMAGYTFGNFELDLSATGFSAAPTAGAVINIYEQKINSNAQDAIDVSATNRNDYIGSFRIPTADGTDLKFRVEKLPINRQGGKYWLEWVDGGAGTASIDAAFTLRLFLATYAPAA